MVPLVSDQNNIFPKSDKTPLGKHLRKNRNKSIGSQALRRTWFEIAELEIKNLELHCDHCYKLLTFFKINRKSAVYTGDREKHIYELSFSAKWCCVQCPVYTKNIIVYIKEHRLERQTTLEEFFEEFWDL